MCVEDRGHQGINPCCQACLRCGLYMRQACWSTIIQRLSCPYFPPHDRKAGTSYHHLSAFYVAFRDLNSGPRAQVANTISPDLSPSSLLLFHFVLFLWKHLILCIFSMPHNPKWKLMTDWDLGVKDVPLC